MTIDPGTALSAVILAALGFLIRREFNRLDTTVSTMATQQAEMRDSLIWIKATIHCPSRHHLQAQHLEGRPPDPG